MSTERRDTPIFLLETGPNKPHLFGEQREFDTNRAKCAREFGSARNNCHAIFHCEPHRLALLDLFSRTAAGLVLDTAVSDRWVSTGSHQTRSPRSAPCPPASHMQ